MSSFADFAAGVVGLHLESQAVALNGNQFRVGHDGRADVSGRLVTDVHLDSHRDFAFLQVFVDAVHGRLLHELDHGGSAELANMAGHVVLTD